MMIAQKKLKKQIQNNDLNSYQTDRKYYKEVKDKNMKKMDNCTLSYQKRNGSEGGIMKDSDGIQIQNGKYNFKSCNQHVEQYFRTHVDCYLERNSNQN